MTGFIAIAAAASASQIEQETYETLEAKFAGWAPAEGNLEVWLIKAFSRIAGGIYDTASLMSKEAFKRFGEDVANVPPVQAVGAFVESTWTMIDTAGYTIPAGTQVEIEAAGDRHVGFAVTEEVVVAPGGATALSVPLRAVEPGVEGNGLTADPTLVDALAFVNSIELDGTTANGVDAEDEDTYLDRLTEALQLLSFSLIVQRDFEIDARAIPAIARAVCLPGYNPLDDTLNNPLMFATASVDAAGAKASAPTKEALLTRQTAKVPSGVVPRVFDPTYTKVDVTETIKVLAGYDPVAVEAAVEAVLVAYFSPANWGLPEFGDTGSSAGWVNRLNVYINELISLSDRVPGVDRVVGVVANRTGNTLEAKDFNLLGRVALPEPGTIVVSAV